MSSSTPKALLGKVSTIPKQLGTRLFSPETPLAVRPKRVYVGLAVLALSAILVLTAGIRSGSYYNLGAVALLSVAVVRVYSLLRAVGWIWQRGDSFATALGGVKSWKQRCW